MCNKSTIALGFVIRSKNKGTAHRKHCHYVNTKSKLYVTFKGATVFKLLGDALQEHEPSSEEILTVLQSDKGNWRLGENA